MRSIKILVTLFAVALVCSIYSPIVKADDFDKKTIITFSGPVEVQGKRLEGGTYVFKLIGDPTVDRHTVQISTADEKHVITTIQAIPDWRVTPTSKTSIKFSEKAGDVATMERELPEAGIPIKEWFYPGDNFGQEFLVKPAAAIAQTTTETTETAQSTPPPVVEERHEEAEEKPVETAQVQPPSEPAPVVAQPAPEEPAPAKPESTELPQTASPMPLIGLVGLISLGLGISIRQLAKRMA